MEALSKQSGSLLSCSMASGSLQSCSFHSGSLEAYSMHSDNSQSQDLHSTSVQTDSLTSTSVQSSDIPSCSMLPSKTLPPNELSFTSTKSEASQMSNQPSLSMQSSKLCSSSMGSSKLSQLLLSQHNLALQAYCKQALKSRLFRGFYIERRYVEVMQGYRDIVALEKSEQQLYKILIDIHSRVVQFYLQQTKSIYWFGLSFGKLQGAPIQPGSMEVYIWTELKDLAYGQYWFSIKTVRFREVEILLKLKMVRLVENEGREAILRQRVPSLAVLPHTSKTQLSNEVDETIDTVPSEAQIGVKEFIDLVKIWGDTIKIGVYDFMANDITKHNIMECLKFIGLMMISLASGIVFMTKNLGTFTIHLLFEMSRLAHILTPVLLKLIDVLNKAIGGFYILLTMVWKDAMVYLANRGKLQIKQGTQNYKGIEFQGSAPSTRHQQQRQQCAPGVHTSTAHYGGFERKFPM